MWDSPNILRLISKTLSSLAVLMLLFSAGFWLIHSDWFPVRKIYIEGHLKRVTPMQLKFIAEHELSGTFFTVDIDKTRAAFEKLPWVKEAQVRRRWPDQLDIQVTEHQALARWGGEGLVDLGGAWFDAASDQVLPVFYGPAGTQKQIAIAYRQYCEWLKPTGLYPVKIWLSARNAWQIELNNGVLLELGRGEIKEKLLRFINSWTPTLSQLAYPVEYVDLRYPNGFAVRMAGYKPPPVIAK